MGLDFKPCSLPLASFNQIDLRDPATIEAGVAAIGDDPDTPFAVMNCSARSRDEGPVLVVYPDNVWYTYVDKEDIDEIIDSHLVHGRVVQRLRLPEDAA